MPIDARKGVPPHAAAAAGGWGIVLRATAPFALGYFFSYLFRAVNLTVGPYLQSELGLSADDLGLITAAYLFAFAGFQMPLGLLLDRFGPRRVQASLLCGAAIGALLFGLGESAEMLILARALIGIGFAGGLMASYKSISLWLPRPRIPLANASVMAFGALGALFATLPVLAIIDRLGWRGVFFVFAGCVFLIALSILIFAKEAPPGDRLSFQSFRGFGRIFSDPLFLRIAPLVALSSGAHIAFLTLWASTWLRDVVGLDETWRGPYLMAMTAAFSAGIMSSGLIADFCQRRGIDVVHVLVGGIALALGAQIIIITGWSEGALPVLILYGMTGQFGALAYARLSQHFGPKLVGRSNTSLNFLTFSTASLAQYAIGVIINLWPAPPGLYHPAGYAAAFASLWLLQLGAFAWYWLAPRWMGRFRQAG